MSAHPSNDRDRSAGGIWPSLNRFLITLIVLTISSVAGYRCLPEVSKRREHDARIEALKTEIEQQKQLLARRTREEYLLKNDLEFIGIIARDRLDLMKPGEVIYRIDAKR